MSPIYFHNSSASPTRTQGAIAFGVGFHAASGREAAASPSW
ncbi:hypothetical protein [Nostoc sp.]